MKFQSKRLMLMAAVATFLILCTASSGIAQIKLVVWHGYRGQEKVAFEEVIDLYNTKVQSSGIIIKTLAVPYDAYADKITAAVPRGKGPDVFIFAQDRLGGWIESGKTVEPLDFFMEDEVRARFIDLTLEAMTYHGSIYGLPFNFKSLAMIYNKAMIKTPPKTTGELVNIAKQFTDSASGRFGLTYWYPNWYFHAALMNGFGGRAFNEKGQPVINNPENIASVKYMLKWYQDDAIMPAEPSTALVTTLFNAGKTPIVFNGPWFLGEVADNIDYGVALLPTIDEAGGASMKPWVTVEGLYIAAPSKHKEQAYELIKYLTSLDVAKTMALKGRQLPANKAVYEVAEVAGDPTTVAFRKQLEFAVSMPNLAEMTMMWSPCTTAMNKIVKGAASVEAALKEAQDNLVQNISSLRKSQ